MSTRMTTPDAIAALEATIPDRAMPFPTDRAAADLIRSARQDQLELAHLRRLLQQIADRADRMEELHPRLGFAYLAESAREAQDY